MAKTGTRHVNRSQLAEETGKSLPTIDNWVRKGCPVVKKGGRGQQWLFDPAAVNDWREVNAREEALGNTVTDAEELKRRKLAAETEMAELELAKAKGEVAMVEDFERVQAASMALIRSNIMNVPARAVLQLLGETNETAFKAKLKAELVLALTQAATEEIDIDDDE